MEPTDQDIAQQKFKESYVIGVKKPTSFVYEIPENKHGIDNPVQDLNVNSYLVGGNFVAGFLTVDLSDLTQARTYTAQDVDGTLTLQSGSLISTRIPFANSSGVLVDSTNFTFVSPALTIGVAGNATGQLKLTGSTSGTITLQPANAAGTWTFTLPTSGGTINYFLQTNGSGVTTWAQGNLGDFVGPGSSTDNAVVRFDGTTGKLGQNSGLLVSDIVSKTATLSISVLESTDKTFTFPNQTGTFALQEKIVVNLGEVITNNDEVIFIN